EDRHFLRAVFHQPDDDTLRLIYADWLEERGDPRGDFLRLEVELHRLAKGAEDRKATLQTEMANLQPELDADWVTWMSWTRNLTPGTRLDLVSLRDGKGLIEVRGGHEESVLLVEGKPVALNWDDCCGSVGQYLVFTGHTCGSEYARQLGEFVAGPVDDDRPLGEQIEPLLALFVPGTYSLWYTPSTISGSIAIHEYSGQSSANRELLEYYPADDRNLICTQTRESLNEERVAFFRKQIR